MKQDEPIIIVAPRHELPHDEPVQLVLDDDQHLCSVRIRERTPITGGIAEVINELVKRRRQTGL